MIVMIILPEQGSNITATRHRTIENTRTASMFVLAVHPGEAGQGRQPGVILLTITA